MSFSTERLIEPADPEEGDYCSHRRDDRQWTAPPGAKTASSVSSGEFNIPGALFFSMIICMTLSYQCKLINDYLSGIGKWVSISLPISLTRLEALWGGWRSSDTRELWVRTTGRWRRPVRTNPPLRWCGTHSMFWWLGDGWDNCGGCRCGNSGGEDDDGEVDGVSLKIPGEMRGSAFGFGPRFDW